MGKAALTFAEIFIVLGLIFLIQTVANFNIFEGDSRSPPPDFEVLKLRQVPSDNSDADHIRYLSVSGPDPSKALHLQLKDGGSAVWEQDIQFSINENGVCLGRDSSSALGRTLRLSQSNDLDTFKALLLRNFGVSMSIVEVSNSQDEYVFSWVPETLPSNTTLKVALDHCFLSVSDSSLSIDPAWKLGDTRLQYPHPLIVDRTEFRETITRHSPQLANAHRDSLPDPLSKLSGSQYAGLAFSNQTKNCDLSGYSRRRVRSLAVLEVSIPLKE